MEIALRQTWITFIAYLETAAQEDGTLALPDHVVRRHKPPVLQAILGVWPLSEFSKEKCTESLSHCT